PLPVAVCRLQPWFAAVSVLISRSGCQYPAACSQPSGKLFGCVARGLPSSALHVAPKLPGVARGIRRFPFVRGRSPDLRGCGGLVGLRRRLARPAAARFGEEIAPPTAPIRAFA